MLHSLNLLCSKWDKLVAFICRELNKGATLVFPLLFSSVWNVSRRMIVSWGSCTYIIVGRWSLEWLNLSRTWDLFITAFVSVIISLSSLVSINIIARLCLEWWWLLSNPFWWVWFLLRIVTIYRLYRAKRFLMESWFKLRNLVFFWLIGLVFLYFLYVQYLLSTSQSVRNLNQIKLTITSYYL